MELSNNAIQIYREGVAFRSLQPQGFNISTRCLQLANNLSKCVLSKGLNVLNHDSVKQNCETEEWIAECPGVVRRHQFEKIYKKTINRRLYTQDQLDRYMATKNNHTHFGLVDHRY